MAAPYHTHPLLFDTSASVIGYLVHNSIYVILKNNPHPQKTWCSRLNFINRYQCLLKYPSEERKGQAVCNFDFFNFKPAQS